jgi:hypothetical protein
MVVEGWAYQYRVGELVQVSNVRPAVKVHKLMRLRIDNWPDEPEIHGAVTGRVFDEPLEDDYNNP